jgi:hypothetical protein
VFGYGNGVGYASVIEETGRNRATAGGRRQANGQNLNSHARPGAHPAKRRAGGIRAPYLPLPAPGRAGVSPGHPFQARPSGPVLAALWLWRCLSGLAICGRAAEPRATRFEPPRSLSNLSPPRQLSRVLVPCGGIPSRLLSSRVAVGWSVSAAVWVEALAALDAGSVFRSREEHCV